MLVKDFLNKYQLPTNTVLVKSFCGFSDINSYSISKLMLINGINTDYLLELQTRTTSYHNYLTHGFKYEACSLEINFNSSRSPVDNLVDHCFYASSNNNYYLYTKSPSNTSVLLNLSTGKEVSADINRFDLNRLGLQCKLNLKPLLAVDYNAK